MRPKDALGRYGEELACRYLVDAGYRIVARNWRSPAHDLRGEIDIVAYRDRTVVFCEVKTRRSTAFGAPTEAITPAKSSRMRRLAALWLLDNPHHPPWIRIDVIGIIRPLTGPSRVEHLKGVLS